MDNNDIENALKFKYNIDVAVIEKSKESTDGNVYIISDINKKKYVIKVYNDINHAKAMVQLHTYIYEIGLSAPSIINNNDDKQVTKHKDTNIVCYSFAKGIKLKEIDLTDKRIENIAKYLKKLHNINENIFNLKNVPYEVDSNRQSVLHFDITKHNIFVDNDDICFIDYDDAKFGSPVCDVAIALTNLFISKANGVDMHGMKLFIDAYYQDNKILREIELQKIKDVAIKWLKSIIDNSNFDTSTRAGLENKLKCWNEINMLNLT